MPESPMAMSGRTRALRAVVAIAATAAAVLVLVLLGPPQLYPWLKSLHVIAIIAWMAGMLYLPRLFVYHCEAEPGSKQSETFKVMERRLLRAIINPAMVVSWVVGLWLAWVAGFFTSPWFLAKLALVFALSGVHGYFSAAVRAFARDRNTKSAAHWRVMNEVPTVLMVGIVVLVIVKPW